MSFQRQDSKNALAQNPDFDVIILGGGINGIGVFRDLALQGLRVLLVERNDFCSGCSAAPSRMIHGGLRYLENGEFNLVQESITERDALLRNAPHYVRPLPTTIPITSWFTGTMNAATSFLGGSGQPSRRGALPIKLGLSLYDWVTRRNRTLPKHQFHSAKTTRKERPWLMQGLRCSATFYDAWISHPERLGLELIQDARAANPNAIALNYAELSPSEGGFTVKDNLGSERFQITGRALVNATGAWLDQTIAALDPEARTKEPLVSGTKGSHLILDNPDLMTALDGHMIYFENEDGRVCIVFPYLGKVLAGSTDIRVDEPVRVRCSPKERDYILASLARVFPHLNVSKDQIAFSYSGIRPLPKSTQDFTGRISRGHATKRLDGHVPQFCMVGGKWTTFRAFAEQTTDDVLAELGATRTVSTRNLAIGGGKGCADAQDEPAQALARKTLVEEYKITPERAAHLAASYGTGARKILEYCDQYPNDAPLVVGSNYTHGEIAYLAEHEFVVTLADVVLRRTVLAITGQISSEIIDQISEILAQHLEWSPKETSLQRAALLTELDDFHDVSPLVLDNRNNIRK
ncbi:glycerol-3-phosphate dehydrogenase/oxidase [Falsihalocynthiibacter sp. BN13B15]|uniref:glycerol-3-phosphate dehydrogenase/oxidase n=1 Tax=Falsihalocynthiibacter sp. BN13B15 TaxID=3240871 RepID=UPI00350F2A1E